MASATIGYLEITTVIGITLETLIAMIKSPFLIHKENEVKVDDKEDAEDIG